MSRVRGNLSLTLILIMILSSTLLIHDVSANSAPKPAVPEFTLKYVLASWNMTPENYWPGHNFIEVILRNQYFTPYSDLTTNSTVSLYYGVQVKLHNESIWSDVYGVNLNGGYPPQSNDISTNNTNYTVLPMPYPLPENISAGEQVDFRVQAIIGNLTLLNIPQPRPDGVPSWFSGFFGSPTTPQWTAIDESNWSSTQSITIPADYSSVPIPTPPPTSTATNTLPPEDKNPLHLEPVIYLLPISIIVAIIIATALLYRRRQKTAK